MPFFRPGPPRVFAHRGGAALGPENTIAAFDLGMAAGADGLELDVRLSSDGVVVVCHDETLDRTTDATGPVSAQTASALERVDAAYRFIDDRGHHVFRGRGVGIPRLVDVLRRYKGVPAIVEMKLDTAHMGRAVAEAVRVADVIDSVCAAGFGLRALRAAREAQPGMATSACHPEVRLALYRSWAGWPLRRAPFGGYQVPEIAGTIRVTSPRFIRHAHRAGLEVQVWTIDEEADMSRLLDWGADGLISNRPDLAVRVRDRFVAGRQSPMASR